MRHQRRYSQSKRTTEDILMEAKRRFQFKPTPTRKPHVSDIIPKVIKAHHALQKQKKSMDMKTQNLSIRKSETNKSIQKSEQLKQASKQIDSKHLRKQQSKKGTKEDCIDSKSNKFYKSQTISKSSSKQKLQHLSCKNTKQLKNRSLGINLNNGAESQHKNTLPINKSKTFIKKPEKSSSNMRDLSSNQSHLKKHSQSDIQVLAISQPIKEQKKQQKLELLDISFSTFNIQVKDIQEPNHINDSKKTISSKKFKYNLNEEENQNKYSSELSLSPVKGYYLENQQKYSSKYKTPSLQIKKGIKQPIIEVQQEKIIDSRVIQKKASQIFEFLEDRRLGTLTSNNTISKYLTPEINLFICQIIKNKQNQNKALTRKEFLIQFKRMLLRMEQKQIKIFMNTPIYQKLKERRFSDYIPKTNDKQNTALCFAADSNFPSKNRDRNSISDRGLFQLSNRDLLKEPVKNLPNKFSSRQHEWYKGVQCQLEGNKIDALNQRLSVYISRHNIGRNKLSQNQMNFQFYELKKHLC